MGNYEELTDLEKSVDFLEEFIQELRKQYHEDDPEKAMQRADDCGIDLLPIIA